MPVITTTLPPGARDFRVTAIQQALISLGTSIDGGELATATTTALYGATTQVGVTALLTRFGFLPATPPVFNATVGRLLHLAVGAEVGHSAGLRQNVREVFAVLQTAPAAGVTELAWLARYATMARDFTT